MLRSIELKQITEYFIISFILYFIEYLIDNEENFNKFSIHCIVNLQTEVFDILVNKSFYKMMKLFVIRSFSFYNFHNVFLDNFAN